ncbi:MAG: MlaD family protein [Sandaracinaceae bacterium]
MASTRTRGVLLTLGLLGLLLAGCDPTYTARLTDGGGLIEGSPVRVAQVTVGEVRSLRVVEGQVEVEIQVEREHELSMRVDTCAVPVQTPAGPALALSMGTGALLDEPKTIPQCQPPADQMGDFLEQLGRGMGDLLRVFGQGLQDVTRPPPRRAPVAPSPVVPAPTSPASPVPAPSSPANPAPSTPAPTTPIPPPPNMPPPPDQAI